MISSRFVGPQSPRTKAHDYSIFPPVNAKPATQHFDALAQAGYKDADGVPITVSSGSVITAYDPAAGTPLWQKDLGKEFYKSYQKSVSYTFGSNIYF